MSLKWKLAFLFGGVFLILHSIFSYLSYLHAVDNFALHREQIQDSHINIARTLTENAFLDLEQFAELLSSIDSFSSQAQMPLSALDENWSRWQLSWGIENITLFNQNGSPIKSWGKPINIEPSAITRVLGSEEPDHQIICPDDCFQQVIVPVMGPSKTIGTLSLSRSFANVLVKYKQTTRSDMALLVAVDDGDTAKAHRWAYKPSGITLPEKNSLLFDYVSARHTVAKLLASNQTITFNNDVFDIRVIPVNAGRSAPPFFLLMDDITLSTRNLNTILEQVWLYGIISLLASLLLLVFLLHLSLRHIARLSEALPLLSRHRYDQFRQRITVKSGLPFGYDELYGLNQTALTLADQLQQLEQKDHSNTLMLLEKSRELAKERDFSQQLIEVAPIIVITQTLNGTIISINQAGLDGFDVMDFSVIGKSFDIFLPASDNEHLKKLHQLRKGQYAGLLQVDGVLVTETGKQRDITWLHTCFKAVDHHDKTIILTLGVDISERKNFEDKIFKMTTYDSLTGLINRRRFQEKFADELASAKRYAYQVALFYLDLDQFKIVNDNDGHETGDMLLVQVANTLKETIRTTDTLCRIGGDEFTLILPHAELNDVSGIAEKINQTLISNLFSFADKPYKISASIGLAIFPEHGLTVHELLANAELAMYQAKASGRGQYHIYSADVDYQEKLKRSLYWQEIIEDAIAHDKFVLYYQPILNINSNRISHFECLIRLRQDNGQIIPPNDFIGHAEELGLIGKIDRLVLKKAVQKHIEFKNQGLDYKLTVNLSGCSFNDTTIFKDISRLVNVPEVNPGNIIFEITETAAVSNFAAAEILIGQIKELGCLLALDDFGVGFSSFHYLKHFPVDYVKIDGSFIRQIHKSDDDKIFVKALSEVAQAFGKKIVAEFVENEAILTILKEFKIDYAQGYHIGKPVDEPLAQQYAGNNG
ncbi:MAG: EAL domain-containing protein [Methylovulum sp.]|nr:EAL domain-containing protein [Methylovulum sp.]